MSAPDATPKDPVSEADKPFILALIGSFALFGIGVYAVVTGTWANAKDFIAEIAPLVGTAWGFYFKSKA